MHDPWQLNDANPTHLPHVERQTSHPPQVYRLRRASRSSCRYRREKRVRVEGHQSILQPRLFFLVPPVGIVDPLLD